MGHWIEKLQVDWARDAREGPRVLMSLRSTKFRALLSLSLHSSHSSSKLLSMASYGVASPLSLPFSIPLPFIFQEAKESIDEEDPRPTSSNGACIMWYQEHLHLGTNMSLHSSSSVNGEGSTPKDPLYKILDELRSLKLWKEKQERKEKGKKRVEEISQDERKKIREEERRKIIKEMKREKHVSYSSHNSCKSLSEELRDYYEGRHRSHLRPHSHRRENERKPQEVNIKLPYFHGKDNVEANLDWEIRVEQQLKRKSTSKSYGSHSYPKKDQGQGILGVRPSKPKDDKGKTIEKQPLKASMQEKTSSMKCFKCLGRGHITSQCPTKKTMIMRGQDIYSSQDEATTSPSSSKSEEAKGEESSEEIYPQEEGQPLMVKEECKEVSVSSKRLAKKERHFEIKTNIKEISLLRQPPHFLLCKKTLVSIATSLRLEFIPQVKELLDEGLVRKRLNPCALLVPKIGVKGRSPEYQEPQDLRFQSSFRAQNFVLFSPSPFIHLILPPSSYPWPPMVWRLLSLSLSPFRCHSSSKKQRNPLMKKILGLQAPMELASCEGQPLMVKEECKEVSVSSKRLAKKERHFEIKTNIKEISLLRQPPHFLLCKKTLVSIATSLRLEFIPQVKELLDEGLVRKRLNPCALLVPKIGIIRHQIPKIGGVMNALGGATLFCKITHAPNIFMICVHRDSLGSFNTNLGTHMGHLRFVILFGRNNQHENTEKGVKGRSPEYQEPQDLRLIFSLKWRLLSLSLSPFRCHSSSKKQRNPLMKKILGLQAPMELASYSLPFGSTALSNFSLTSDNSSIYPLTPCIPSLICPSRPF
ncbi:hypothetical protein HKD37_04G010331 [Glycine soja]